MWWSPAGSHSGGRQRWGAPVAICSRLLQSAVRAAARTLLSCGLAALLPLGAEAAPKRLALVIGNAAYEAIPALANAGNDADAIESLLAEARFEVIRATNADLAGLQGRRRTVRPRGRGGGLRRDGARLLCGPRGPAQRQQSPAAGRCPAGADVRVPQQSVSLGEILKRLDRHRGGRQDRDPRRLPRQSLRRLDRAVPRACRGAARQSRQDRGGSRAGRIEGRHVRGLLDLARDVGGGRRGTAHPFTAALLQHAREPGARRGGVPECAPRPSTRRPAAGRFRGRPPR